MNSEKNDTNKYRRKKRKNWARTVIALFLITVMVILLGFFLISLILKEGRDDSLPFDAEPFSEMMAQLSSELSDENTIPSILLAPLAEEGDEKSETDVYAGKREDSAETKETDDDIEDSEKEQSSGKPYLKETDIYSFLQGPKAWKSKTDWSGSWCDIELAGQKFSVFGCGLCDLANVYSTLTLYDCSPIDMYWYAQEVSDYAPVDGYGAIDWPYMKKTLQTTGISCRLKRKDRSFEQFRESIAGGITAIVNVSSANDSTYWHEVYGHYVNIWLYSREDDTVFLADSGNPEHNRQRIPLRYIYDALKTSDRYQYLLVTKADETANTWQHDGIDLKWRKPKYYKSSQD